MQGAPFIKVKLGKGNDAQGDIERVKAIRQAIGIEPTDPALEALDVDDDGIAFLGVRSADAEEAFDFLDFHFFDFFSDFVFFRNHFFPSAAIRHFTRYLSENFIF